MGTQSDQNKSVGSAYFNLKKGASQEDIDRVAELVNELKELNAYLAVSLRKNDGSGFVKLSAFFNGYKRDDQKDPDMLFKMSTIGQSQGGNKGNYKKPYNNNQRGGAKPSYNKPAPKPQATRPAPKQEVNDESESEEIPF